MSRLLLSFPRVLRLTLAAGLNQIPAASFALLPSSLIPICYACL